jgi:DNA polymerase-3 subunit alpha
MFGYPVLLQHYFDRFWEAGSVIGVGRGSAAAALNHYLLGLTQLDPVEYNMPFFRYMNKENCGLGDIDIDVCSTKRPSIIKDIKQERYHYFNENISEEAKKNLGAVFVGTFGTETTKAAVGTACRGYRSEEFPDGIDIDIAQYLSSLIPSERGFLWPIHDVIYGNEEKGRKPSKTFLDEANKFPGLIEIIEGIEGMISRRGIHASGLILLEDDPFEKTAFMKAPNGELTTQFDLGDCEAMGLTKLDILITQASDKIMKTLELLQADGVFDKDKTLREIYNESVHPDVMNLEDEEVWNNIKKGNVLSLFQFDTPIGGQGVRRLQPKNIQELSNCNALIRLMTGDDGENPIDHYERLMQGRDIWVQEMNQFHLTKEEQEAIMPYLEESYGLGISQEQLMLVLMDKNICGFTLKDANKARKVVSKKKMNQIPALQKQVYEQACSKNMAEYVWQNVVKPQLGYAFSSIHSMSYTMIGYQTAYLSTKWPSVYWNTACLIVDSGSADEDNSGKGSNYDKIARAVGSITSHGVNVQLIDINESDFTFKPDANNNLIWYGLKAVDRVSDDTVKEIKAGRPYSGVKDFIRRCPQQKNIMISLVKSGAFDSLDNEWASKICPEEPRKAIMAYYLTKTANLKEKVTMQNFSTLLKNNLIPDYLKEEVDIWRYTAFLRDKKNGRRQEKTYLIAKEEMNRVTEIAPDLDYGMNDEYYVVFQKDWDKAYMGAMESVKNWLSNNQEEILKSLNSILFKEEWDKYAKGSISKWEMESLCYYYNEHELAHVNKDKYGVQDFYRLPENPKPIRFFKQYPIYALTRIVGTVIGKNKTRSTVTLLTVDGVVDVKMTKDYFANIDRQISEIQEDGKRKKVEASWATRGNLMMFTGYRRDNTFVCKKYSKTPGHQAYLITTIDKEGSLKLTHERADELE